jgi:SAM-dependent methyltransferase
MVDTDPGAWSDFYEATADRGLNERFLRAIELTAGNEGAGKVAIDLGSGAGVESKAFLDRGWSVFAIDAEPAAIERLLAEVGGEQRRRLTAVVGAFDEVELPQADLVFAQYSLPFAAADRLDDSVRAALAAVKPGGWFYGQLFGPNDDWANKGTTPIDRAAIIEHFAGFDPVSIEEEDAVRDTVNLGMKRWHVFTIEAQRSIKYVIRNT